MTPGKKTIRKEATTYMQWPQKRIRTKSSLPYHHHHHHHYHHQHHHKKYRINNSKEREHLSKTAIPSDRYQ